VITGIDLTVGRGESVFLLGRNGSGKTTLLRGLMGLLPAAQGSIELDGTPLGALVTHRRARAGLAYVPQGRDIFPDLTVEENLRLGHVLAGRPMRTPLPSGLLDHFPWMHERLGQAGGTLSGGQQQMVAIARVLVGEPKLLLLDEPTEGLAPTAIEDLVALLSKVVSERMLDLLVVEQNISFAFAVATRGYVVEKGAIAWAGSQKEFQDGAVAGQFLAI
jgi:urea transport system ATP-binding protein